MLIGHPPVGTRQRLPQRVGEMSGDALVQIWTRCTSAVVKYGFSILYRDLEPPRTGIFNGRQLVIDPDVGFEMQCFVLLHLFGHSVQWVAPSLEAELAGLTNSPELESFLKFLRGYEYKAAEFGLQLLHEAGLTDFDVWYSDFVATDWRYVERYYREGAIPPWEECVLYNASLVAPRAIPPLVLRDVQVRYAF